MYTVERLKKEVKSREFDLAKIKFGLGSDECLGGVFKDPDYALSVLHSVMHGTAFEDFESVRHITEQAEKFNVATVNEQAKAMNDENYGAELAHGVLEVLKHELTIHAGCEPDSAEQKMGVAVTLLKSMDMRQVFGEMRGSQGFQVDAERKNAISILKSIGEKEDPIVPLIQQYAEIQMCIDDLEKNIECAPTSQDLAGESSPVVEQNIER